MMVAMTKLNTHMSCILILVKWAVVSEFTNYFQEHSLPFTPRLCKCECDVTWQYCMVEPIRGCVTFIVTKFISVYNVFTNHSQEHSLAFSPRYSKFE